MQPAKRNIIQLSLVFFIQGLPLLFPKMPALSYASLVVNAVLALVFIIQSPSCFSWIATLKQHLKAPSILLGLFYGVLLGFLFDWVLLPLFSQWFNQPLTAQIPSNLNGNFKFLFLVLLAIGLTSGFCYEIIWRGFLFERTKQVAHSQIAALVLTSLASGVFVLHLGYAHVLSAVLLSLVLGVIYINNKYNIIQTILAHALADSLFFIAVYLNIPTTLW